MRLALFALLPLAWLCTSCQPAPEPRAANLLFISLDTVRRDHLPVYGYERDTAPALQRFATGAFVFENAFAQEVNTNPSHVSMFTGVYPHAHGSLRNRDRLPEAQVTLAQILQRKGFATGAFVASVVMSAPLTSLERGFDVYDDVFFGEQRAGRPTVNAALRWLKGLDAERRFFLFLHLYDAHGPYSPPPEYAERFVSAEPGPLVERIPPYQEIRNADGSVQRAQNDYVDRYDAEIRLLDDLLSKMLAAVAMDETLIVVVADHGETLGERYHKFDHGTQLYDEQIRIPLLLHVPGTPPRRVPQLVETVDLLPTLLELLGLAVPSDRPIQGQSLAPLLEGEPRDARRATFASARVHNERHADRGYRLDTRSRILSIRTDRWKLIRYPGHDETYYELYDLAADPAETVNVAESHPDLLATLAKELREWSSTAVAPRGTEATLDDATLEQLRALGYAD